MQDVFFDLVLGVWHDAGTTGAICGQLAGVFWGESQISGPLRSAWHEWICWKVPSQASSPGPGKRCKWRTKYDGSPNNDVAAGPLPAAGVHRLGPTPVKPPAPLEPPGLLGRKDWSEKAAVRADFTDAPRRTLEEFLDWSPWRARPRPAPRRLGYFRGGRNCFCGRPVAGRRCSPNRSATIHGRQEKGLVRQTTACSTYPCRFGRQRRIVSLTPLGI